ncbi:hypothetical protein LAG90_14700 [Marinilongibacter aquaticus]|uniref:hypothetical protein n=1 Tax=Marinilongibacter aquaticus TaxID=2975157 RepID=UPI0021BD09BC|nr:hypothetical protein [Marinilongibacter aquaticus]UBM58054.1 hypothetical protein LAG90_14700 [Marinilongibacter aquaticus]
MMNTAILKTIILILLIAVGFVLKGKFGSKDKVNGIKEMVLSVALPSTIFIALMKINLEVSLLIVPLVTLIFNFFLYMLTPYALTLFGIDRKSTTARTLRMLIPSLAPGLSCFPFIAEFLGDESLALAAMSDVGNKFFVLIFLYVIAMNFYLSRSESQGQSNLSQKIKSLLVSLVQEPINILLALALTLLAFGFHYNTLPVLVQGIFDKTSMLMTPQVLIFIGLAVNFKEGNKRLVLSLLMVRAGISVLFSAVFIALAGLSNSSHILLALVLPLSSISFWPFAHMSLFNGQEEEQEVPKEKRTFDIPLAIMVLALSLPFSTTLILTILSAGEYFVDLWKIVALGFGLLALGGLPQLAARLYFKLSSGKMA